MDDGSVFDAFVVTDVEGVDHLGWQWSIGMGHRFNEVADPDESDDSDAIEVFESPSVALLANPIALDQVRVWRGVARVELDNLRDRARVAYFDVTEEVPTPP